MEKMIENATVIPFNMNLRPGKDSVEYFGEFYKHFTSLVKKHPFPSKTTGKYQLKELK